MSASRLRVAGSLQRLHQRVVELGDDVLRRALRHPERMPEVEIESRQPRLVGRRHVRHRRRALVRRHREGLEQAVAHVPARGRRRVHHHVDVARQQILRGRSGAAIRHELRSCAPMVFWKNMPETWPGLPMPALPTVTLPGLALIQAISSFRLFGRQRLSADDHGRLGRDQPDRLQVLQQIDRQIVHRAAGDIGAPLADLHGVAVGRRARDADHAGRAAGAGRILDDHRLAEMRPHAFGHDAPDRVGRSAGGERHQYRDGTRGEGLRVRAADRAGRGQRNGDHRLYHLFPPRRWVHSSTSTSPGPRRSDPAPAFTSTPIRRELA